MNDLEVEGLSKEQFMQLLCQREGLENSPQAELLFNIIFDEYDGYAWKDGIAPKFTKYAQILK